MEGRSEVGSLFCLVRRNRTAGLYMQWLPHERPFRRNGIRRTASLDDVISTYKDQETACSHLNDGAGLVDFVVCPSSRLSVALSVLTLGRRGLSAFTQVGCSLMRHKRGDGGSLGCTSWRGSLGCTSWQHTPWGNDGIERGCRSSADYRGCRPSDVSPDVAIASDCVRGGVGLHEGGGLERRCTERFLFSPHTPPAGGTRMRG
mmetsp:Transcript_13917/g.27786  ORF Transcript_13917/g.27786 Transcript_13917/m.27786 type:complete len:203 (-) Transcript_13917:996-1604(-)